MNKTNHPVSSNSHPSATANKAIHSLKIRGGGLQNKREHHIIVTWNICNWCGLPAGNANPSGHLASSLFRACICHTCLDKFSYIWGDFFGNLTTNIPWYFLDLTFKAHSTILVHFYLPSLVGPSSLCNRTF